MIVFDLHCREASCTWGETFEAWFRSNADFEQQCSAGLVQCPVCGSPSIEKAPMAPSVLRKGGSSLLARVAAVQAEMLKNSRWVGDEFVDTARAMYSGEIEPAQVHGNATLDQAKSLAEDGIPVAPLPLPVTPPSQVN
jgi:hypothetical protein